MPEAIQCLRPGRQAWARGGPRRCGLGPGRNAVRALVLVSAAVLLPVIAIEPPPVPPEGQKTVRELFVPFDDLQVLLDAGPRRVMLTREQFEVLEEQARQERAKQPPLAASLAAASYTLRVDNDQATIEGALTVEVLTENLQAIPLDLSGVGLREALLDEQAAPLGQQSDGQVLLFVAGKGLHRLRLAAVAPVETSAATQTLTCQLPVPAATELQVVVPGDVEIRSGAAVATREYDEKAGLTRFSLVPRRGPLTLVLSLNSRLRSSERLVVARSVLVDEVTPGFERLHATLALEVLHRAVADFRFAVPAGFEVTDVRGPLLAHWTVQPQDGRPVLEARLREATTETVVLTASACRTAPPLDGWTLPRFEPLDVISQVAVAGLLLDPHLQPQDVVATGTIPIDAGVLAQAWPETLDPSGGVPETAPRLVLAYYAPQAAFGVQARLAAAPAKVLAETRLQLAVEDQGLRLLGRFGVRAERDPVFAVDFALPVDWQVTEVTAVDGKPLAFERYTGPDRVHAALPDRVPAGQLAEVLFSAVQVPADWISGWAVRQQAFPQVGVLEANRDTGVVAVEARDDLVVRPAAIEGLVPLDAAERAKAGLAGLDTGLAYRYQARPYTFSFTVERNRPRLTAEAYSFFRLEPDALTTHVELVYAIEQARARQVEFSLPLSTPAGLTIRGLAGTQVKECVQQERDGRRHWTVLLAGATRGRVQLAFDFQQRLDAAALADLSLPLVQAETVAYQSGLLAIEGNPELTVRIPQPPRRVDIGELVQAEYQPGPRLLGAFGYVGEPPTVRVAAECHSVCPLPSTLVQLASITSVLAGTGTLQSSARFDLRTKATFLEFVLPQPSTLWSVVLDGRPARPQQTGDRMLVGLPPAPENAMRQLRLVYETAGPGLRAWGRRRLTAPQLFVYDPGSTRPVTVPLADLAWRVYTPPGYRAIAAAGAVASHLAPPVPGFLVTARTLVALAGGIGLDRGVLGNEGGACRVALILGVVAAALGFVGYGLWRRRRRTALRGCLGLIVVLGILAILASMLLPALSQSRGKAQAINCAGNLKQIALALRMYSDDNDGRFPDSLAMLARLDYLEAGKMYTCPASQGPEVTAENPDYVYLGAGLTENVPSTAATVLVFCQGRHSGLVNAAFVDGHVQGVVADTITAAAERCGWSLPGSLVGGAALDVAAVAAPAEEPAQAAAAPHERQVARTRAQLPSLGQAMAGLGMAETRQAERAAELEAPPVPAAAPVPPPPAAVPSTPAATVAVPAAPAKPAAKKAKTAWFGEGLGGVSIDIESSGQAILFQGLSSGPRLRLTLVHEGRVQAVALGLALAVALAGIALSGAPARRQALWVASVLGVTTLVPALPGLASLALLLNAAFAAAWLLIPYYLLAHAVRRRLATRALAGARTPASVATALLLGVIVWLVAPAPTLAAEPGDDLDVEALADRLRPAPPVQVPDDVILVPYAPDAVPNGSESILVPLDRFRELYELAFPKAPGALEPPSTHGLAGGKLSCELRNAGGLTVEGTLELDLYTDQETVVPVPLVGAVLKHVELDGQPARCGSAPIPVAQGQDRGGVQAETGLRVCLYARGKGRHRLTFAAWLELQRRGGWRVAAAQLPGAPATTVDVRVPEPGTEVLLTGVTDRRLLRTAAQDELIRTALGPDGAFAIQWRPKVTEGQADGSLSARSLVQFSVCEDRLGVQWDLGLEFRQGERDSFDIDVPAGYLIEKISGANVRGWESLAAVAGGPGPARQVVHVSLLKQTKQREQFNLQMWLPTPPLVAAGQVIEVPVVTVQGAARQTGALVIQRSPLLEVRTGETAGVNRADLARIELPAAPADVVTSPIGLRPYQAFEFVTVPFSIRLTVAPTSQRLTAEVQSILRLMERERALESRVLLTVRDRTMHEVVLLVPADLEVERVTAPGTCEWTVAAAGERQRLTLRLAVGLQGEVPVLLHGRLTAAAVERPVSLPRVEVLAAAQQSGDLVVQCDPALDVSATDLVGIESVVPSRAYGWLTPEQRPLSRLVLHYKSADYTGRLALRPRQPDVSGYTVTNVRVTDRAIEETILVDLSVRNAGIREVRFQLPANLEQAKISVPLLRQKTVEPVPGGNTVRVRLELQDAVMDQLRVLVENDRLLTGEPQTAPIPELETGRTDRRYVAVESAGRDEVEIESNPGLLLLTRQQKEWSTIEGLLRGGATQAFIVRPAVEPPRLIYQTKPRKAVETAGARIGLVRTILVLDPLGTYCAEQTYHVDNQTEQFLEVRLPGGAALWTARVASQPVKPVQPDAERPESVQVPLVKTAAGDLDYTVVLRYGGALPALGYLGAADFPLAQARNLNVELSQVELRLPRTHHWLNFASTARRVTQAYEFEAGFLAYQSRLARRLAQTLQYGSEFEKARAYSNLKQVGLALRSSQTRFAQARGAPQAASEMQEADLAIREVDQQLEVAQPSPQAVEGVDNRGGLNLAFTGQRNVVAGRAIEAGGANWDEQQVSRTETDRSQAVTFESSWLAGRRLSKVASKPRSEAAPERAGKLSEARPLSRGKGEAKAKDQPAAGAQPKTPTQAPRPEPADELRRRLGEESDTGAQQRRAGRKELAAKYQQRLQAQAGEGEVGTVTEKIAAEGVDRRQALELKDKADEAAPSAAAGVGPSGLASLDVELPAWDAQRWVRVHFTTPRAGVTIGATALSRQVTALLRRLGAAGLVLLLIYAAWRRVSAAHSLAMAGERLASGLAFAGLAAAGLGVLPWAGLVLLAVGLVWYLCLRRRAGAAG